jgi:hypothetical protein
LAGSFRTQTVDQGSALHPPCACPAPALTLRRPSSPVQPGPRRATEQRFRWSALVWSPPPESNRRPRPYHGTTRNRCADRRYRRSRSTVGVEVIGSPSAKVCVHFRADAEISGSSHPLNSRPRYPLCPQRGRGAAIRQGRNRAATPRSRPAPPPRTEHGSRREQPHRRSTPGNRSRRSRFPDRTLFPGGCPVLSS